MSYHHGADDLLQRIRSLQSEFDERAFLFVLAGLEYCQRRRTERGHISGRELAESCRDFAMEQFGLTARTVLEHWNVHSTQDIGRVVFQLIDVGLLMKQESDKIEDFDSVFDFGEAFDGSYPWPGVKHALEAEFSWGS